MPRKPEKSVVCSSYIVMRRRQFCPLFPREHLLLRYYEMTSRWQTPMSPGCRSRCRYYDAVRSLKTRWSRSQEVQIRHRRRRRRPRTKSDRRRLRSSSLPRWFAATGHRGRRRTCRRAAAVPGATSDRRPTGSACRRSDASPSGGAGRTCRSSERGDNRYTSRTLSVRSSNSSEHTRQTLEHHHWS